MAKIHLVMMPFFRLDVVPPGAACLSAYLKQHKIDVTFTDFRLFENNIKTMTLLGYTKNYVADIPELPLVLSIFKNYQKKKPLLEGLKETIKEYLDDRPLDYFTLINGINLTYNIVKEHIPELIKYDIIGFTVYENNFFFTCLLSLFLRQARSDITIVYGGPQVSQSFHCARLALKLGICDVVVIGEGEETLLEIIRCYDSNKSLAVDGTIVYDESRDQFVSRPRKPLNIRALPCPDFSIFQLSEYGHKNFMLPLYASRGCVNRCNFCNEWKMWAPFRALKPEMVVSNMERLNSEYGAFRFYFTDSLLNFSPSWLEKFADVLIDRKLDFEWRGYFCVDMSESLLKKLKKAGLYRVFVGVESLSDSVLNNMDKRQNSKDSLRVLELFCSNDIQVEVGIFIGFPGSSDVEFQNTWKTVFGLLETYPDNLLINREVFQLRPSSKLYDNYRDYGLSLEYWNSEVKGMVPELYDIVSKIPMAVDGDPSYKEINKRGLIMHNNLQPDIESRYRYEEKQTRRFLEKALKYIKPSYSVTLLLRGVYIYKEPSLSKRDSFVLHWQNGKHILSSEEKMMLDNFKRKTSLWEIAEELSKHYPDRQEKHYNSILSFLEGLLEKDILFELWN